MSLRSLLAVLLLSLALSPAFASERKEAFLIVDKAFDERSVVVGHPLNVEIRIYNAGEGSAYQVMLLESSFAPENYTFLSGNPDKTFSELGPKENVTIAFTVEPLFPGPLEDKPSLISYNPSSYSDVPQRAFSTSKRHIYVLTEDQYHMYVAQHTTEWSVVGGLASFLVLVPLVQYYLIQKRAIQSKLI
jgi:hypothetical protein